MARADRAGRPALSRAAPLDSIAAVSQPRARAPAARVDARRRRAVPRDHRRRPHPAARRLGPEIADAIHTMTRAATASMGPLRIGICAPYDLGRDGGVNSHIRAQARALRRLGHHVSIVGASSRPLPEGEVSLSGAVSFVFAGTETG